MDIVDTLDNFEEDEQKGDYIRSVKQAALLSKCNDRIMICGENHGNKRVALDTLLHHLDIANVQYVSFAALASKVSREETYSSVLSKIKLAMSSGIGVLVFRDLDVALQAYPLLMETVLLSNVQEMARDHNILVVATATSWKATDCWTNRWPLA